MKKLKFKDLKVGDTVEVKTVMDEDHSNPQDFIMKIDRINDLGDMVAFYYTVLAGKTATSPEWYMNKTDLLADFEWKKLNNLPNEPLTKATESETNIYIHYTEDCEPKVFVGKDKADALKFIESFKKKHGTLDDQGDNWIELDKIYIGKKLEFVMDLK